MAMSVGLSVGRSVGLSVCRSVSLSVCLSLKARSTPLMAIGLVSFVGNDFFDRICPSVGPKFRIFGKIVDISSYSAN